MRIGFLGDIHGDYRILNLHAKKCDLQIQVGDFGFLHVKPCDIDLETPTWFIDGNHDNTELLQNVSANFTQSAEIKENLHYKPRGWVEQIDGLWVGFLGGATSTDRDMRVVGLNYFLNENCTLLDLHDLMERTSALRGERKLDILISHVPPLEVCRILFRGRHTKDSSSELVSWAIKELNPEWCFCGHLHWSSLTKIENTKVRVLDINEFVLLDTKNPDEILICCDWCHSPAKPLTVGNVYGNITLYKCTECHHEFQEAL